MVERETRWNYEPCKAERVIVRIPEAVKETYWYAGLAGQERHAVRVLYQPDMTYLLDNEDGQGWHKVTAGGGPEWGHSQLPDSSEILRPDDAKNCPCGEPYDDSDRAAEASGASA